MAQIFLEEEIYIVVMFCAISYKKGKQSLFGGIDFAFALFC